jgi:hypothetical protein
MSKIRVADNEAQQTDLTGYKIVSLYTYSNKGVLHLITEEEVGVGDRVTTTCYLTGKIRKILPVSEETRKKLCKNCLRKV